MGGTRETLRDERLVGAGPWLRLEKEEQRAAWDGDEQGAGENCRQPPRGGGGSLSTHAGERSGTARSAEPSVSGKKVLSGMVATSRMWLLSTCDMSSCDQGAQFVILLSAKAPTRGMWLRVERCRSRGTKHTLESHVGKRKSRASRNNSVSH